MSDLGASPSGNPRAANGGARGISGPVPVPTAPQSGVRTPRDIMNQRQAREREREAARRKEAEAQGQTIPTETFTPTDLQRRQSAERRSAAAAAQVRDSGYRSALPSVGERTPAERPYRTPITSAEAGSASFGRAEPPTEQSDAPGYNTRATSQAQEQPRAVQPQSVDSRQRQQSAARLMQEPNPSAQTQPQTSRAPTASATNRDAQSRSNVSSFPHAFERWEELSSRWEGLTSYWIRRLEHNAEEMRDDPVNQQMSRQITDLSAAGANLFHAVVELQRLRASSERKFQRWFFETRAEQERAQETQARLQDTLEAERQGRAVSSGAVARAEQERKNHERVVNEMRRELQISKDEARRAWEELGRREDIERDRIYSLKEGHATIIGGVQVLPVSALSRGGSLQQRPATREGVTPAPQEYPGYEHQEPSPTDTDPFTGTGPIRNLPVTGFAAFQSSPNPVSSSTARTAIPIASQPPTTAAARTPPSPTYYRQQEQYPHSSQAPQAALHPPDRPFSTSVDDSDEGPELDEQGRVRRDSQGQPIPFRPTVIPMSTAVGGNDPRVRKQLGEQFHTEDADRERARVAQYGRSESSQTVPQLGSLGSSGQPGPSQAVNFGGESYDSGELEPADYEGEGYHESNWQGNVTRHQHPTRLSDVQEEEDERSRTSAGRGSSPGLY